MITDLAPDHVQPWFLRGEQGELAVLVNFGGAAYLTEISNRVLQIDGRLELDHAYRCCFLVHVKHGTLYLLTRCNTQVPLLGGVGCDCCLECMSLRGIPVHSLRHALAKYRNLPVLECPLPGPNLPVWCQPLEV